jgi:hypothetical protein
VRKRKRTLGSTGAVHDDEAGKHLRVALIALRSTQEALQANKCALAYRHIREAERNRGAAYAHVESSSSTGVGPNRKNWDLVNRYTSEFGDELKRMCLVGYPQMQKGK